MRLESATDYVEIELANREVITRRGRLGTRGIKTGMLHHSEELARAAYERAIIDALLAGHARPAGKIPDQVFAIRNPALEQALRDQRDDRDARAIYADWLEANGNPIGELIALQLQHGTRRDPKLEKRFDGVMNRARLPLPDVARLRWKNGMWNEVRIENVRDSRTPALIKPGKADLIGTASTIFRHPLCAALDHLSIGALRWIENASLIKQILEEAAQHAWARDLPSLDIGDCTADPDRDFYMASYDGGALGRSLREGFPGLRTLSVWMNLGHGPRTTRIAGLVLPELRSLAVRGRVDAERLGDLDSLDAPKLERLELWCGGEYTRFASSLNGSTLARVLGGVQFPAVRHLGLVNAWFALDIITSLGATPVAQRLVSLDLSLGALEDQGAKLLAAQRHRFPALEQLVVDRCCLSSTGIQTLRTAFGSKVVIGTQRSGARPAHEPQARRPRHAD